MILSETIFVDFGDVYYDQQIELVMGSDDLSDAEKQSQIQSMEDFKEMYKKPVFKFFITYVEILPIGLIIAFIASLVLKKKIE